MKFKFLLLLAVAALFVAVPVNDGTLFELESCVRDCRNRYNPNYELGNFKDCVEQCIRKYVPPDLL